MAVETTSAGQPERRPAIRTMRSDIAEFLKTSKPTPASLLARQAQWHEYKTPQAGLPWLWIGAAGAVLAIAIVLGFSWRFFGRTGQDTVIETTAVMPAPFFPFDHTSELTAEAMPVSLRNAIVTIAQDQPGSLRRMAVKIRGKGGTAAYPDLAELLKAAYGELPQPFIENAVGPPQIFRYQLAPNRAELGLVVEVREPALVLKSLLTEEPSLPSDLAFLFLGVLPPPVFTRYGDAAYRNINFRFFKAEGGNGGFGYLHFPTRRLIVMATSEESIRAVIDRLLGK